ncbi:MAG TPA: alpha/beta hydrolase [Nitrososphaeraceae archaeon]|nr:alpha/beta hydrolase [Nitrososphaeraceae archaeon]
MNRAKHIIFIFILISIKLRAMNSSRTDSRIIRTALTGITISFGLLSYILLQSYDFVQAQTQNITNVIQTNNNSESKFYIPPTISKEVQEILKNLTTNLPSFPFIPNPDDSEGWQRLNQQTSPIVTQFSRSIVDSYQPNITPTELADISVLDIKPEDWNDNGKVLVYLHGGGYTLLGANSTLGNVVPVANSTGLRVISVDYSLAPFSKWNQTTDEVVSVIQALMDQGYSLNDIAMYGDSAGGGLVAGSVLKMRDQGLGMPAALVLWSPWTDVTGIGDTYFTLSDADPFITNDSQRDMAAAYAHPSDQTHPYVSPVYGNFSSGFPPTLIQGGTKEMLLSDFVRLYQALDQAGIPVKLDIYEGMPHVFQTFFFHNTTESNLAISKTNDFLKEYLDY